MGARPSGRRPAPSVKMIMAGAVRALRRLVGAEMLRKATGGSPAPRREEISVCFLGFLPFWALFVFSHCI